MKSPLTPRLLPRLAARPTRPPIREFGSSNVFRPRPQPHPTTKSTTRPAAAPRTQTRSFLSSFFPSPGGNNNNNNNNNDASNKHRTLTATRTMPYNPTPLFNVISSVESYAEFLPFLTASTVTARDTATGLPTQAFLTVGYGPLSETFTSRVDCDRATWTVQARSGARFGVDSKGGQDTSSNSLSAPGGGGGGVGGALASVFPGANEGIFEYLSTKWELVELGEGTTKVNLEIRFEFRNQMHARMMSAVEGQMAGVMIEAFERRIREVEGV